MPDIAYVSAGKLHLKFGDAAPKQIESKFAHDVRERLIRVQQRHAWKNEGTSARFQGRMLWASSPRDEDVAPVSISSITRGERESHVLYALTGEVNGLFAFDPETKIERRIIHGLEHDYDDLAYSREHNLVACTVRKRDGSSAIATMHTDLTEYAEVTEGDSIDEGANWVPGEKAIVFSSAGLARDKNGTIIALAPAVVHKLDLEDGTMSVLAEEPNAALMSPRITANGDLLYIRRPHMTPKPSFWRANLDFFLFPARLLIALMQYLNFFSAKYTGKPLTTAGNARKKGVDMRQMMVWENLIRADEAKDPDDPQATVPRSWQLIRQRGMKTETIARSVAAFDVAADGTIVYSVGDALYALSPDGAKSEICASPMITHVAFV